MFGSPHSGRGRIPPKVKIVIKTLCADGDHAFLILYLVLIYIGPGQVCQHSFAFAGTLRSLIGGDPTRLSSLKGLAQGNPFLGTKIP